MAFPVFNFLKKAGQGLLQQGQTAQANAQANTSRRALFDKTQNPPVQPNMGQTMMTSTAPASLNFPNNTGLKVTPPVQNGQTVSSTSNLTTTKPIVPASLKTANSGVNTAYAAGSGSSGSNPPAYTPPTSITAQQDNPNAPGYIPPPSSQNNYYGANNTPPNDGTTNNGTTNNTGTQTPDRFAQLNALENAAGSYYQPTADEQNTMQELGNIQESEQLGVNKYMHTPGAVMEMGTGASDYLRNQAAAQTQPLQAKLGILQARRQAAISGYQTAIGAEQTKLGLQQPVQVSPANALISPVTGQQIGGNMAVGGSGGLNLSSLADSVISGQMSPSQAYATLPSQALTYTLQQAIKSKNPNFDFVNAEAQASARTASTQQTGTIGGQLQKSATSANSALDTLQGYFNQLNSTQTGGIPLTNNIATGIAGFFGDQATAAYQTALKDARAQLEGVLTATGASTPTEAGQMAQTYLPDGMTAGQLQSKIAAARALVKQKVEAFGNQNNQAGQTGTGGQTIQTSYGAINPNL